NVFHLKQHYRCTMSDVSAPMLALSRELNPQCEAVLGDMRELRLERTFDCVLVHDAVTYMTSVEQLRAAVHTAFVHTRPGGAAIFTPDDLADDFAERCSLVENDDGAGRSLRCLEWEWDPLPGDDMARTDMAFLLRDGDQVQAVSDCHISGLFARATWIDVLSRAGYAVEIAERPIGEGAVDEIFVCRRPR
ncbi:MAG: class I SAM-dependent methyltransferase, partial [Myxococcales bacterium]|nr:class I SAM-dependent methyltransferase [Myxococcales bacterium]